MHELPALGARLVEVEPAEYPQLALTRGQTELRARRGQARRVARPTRVVRVEPVGVCVCTRALAVVAEAAQRDQRVVYHDRLHGLTRDRKVGQPLRAQRSQRQRVALAEKVRRGEVVLGKAAISAEYEQRV